ncbi:ubiquitin carboxyl-terminal hydrolase isozyme L3, putative [Plasmodium malariae]|uniref:ubiquitinyl hydrolase 1 n=1 Tax=Plasmodium malariae TaxID=5858 RepID=A0A1C3L1B7_PLAMA|nr:ubiquitin carboxyl-terminal hydrolase isozyme L3, putative [Plasmodium malariae]
MRKNNTWVPIESNPDSLYLYSCKLGQTKLKFVDIYGFDKELLDMDGRKDEPVIHSSTTPKNFIYDAGNIIQKVFIEKCQGDNRFSALAVVSSDDA